MSDAPGLWDGRWVVCRADTLASADPHVHDRSIVGIEDLPPAARPAVTAIVGDLARPVDTQVSLPLPAGGHARLTLSGDPSHVEVVLWGAGERPDAHPGDPVTAVLHDGRRAELRAVAACVLGPDGTTSDVSPALATLAAMPARVLSHDGLLSVVDPADHDRVLRVVNGDIDDAGGVRIEPADGGPARWVDVHGVDLRRPDDDPRTAPGAHGDEGRGHGGPGESEDRGGRLLLINDLHARARDLARSAHRASAAFTQAPSGRARLTRDGTIASANPALARMLDAPPEQLTGHRLVDLVDHDDRAALSTLLDAVLRADLGGIEHEVRMAANITPEGAGPPTPPRRDDGPRVWVRLLVEGVTTSGGMEADVEVHDITSRRRAEDVQRDTVDALRSAFFHAPTPMAVIERDGTLREANSELRGLFDLGSIETHRTRLADLAPAADRPLIAAALAELDEGRRVRVECRLRRRDGSEGVVILAVSAVTGPDQASPFAIAQVHDITLQRDTEEKLLHQTLHDPLTGLGNRLLLRERLERATAQRARAPFALMFIDLDHFKAVNDTHGHDAGDALLVEVGRRLHEVVRGDDTVARLGGDEFVVLAAGVSDQTGAEVLAEKVRTVIARPFVVGELELEVTASVGVVLPGAHHTTADSLLRDADASMYEAKTSGRDRHAVTLGDEPERPRPPLADSLRLALRSDSLRLHHQPIVDLRTGRAVGTEALLRVADPVRGDTLPGRLLDDVDDVGLLVDLAGWVLDEVLAQMQTWDEVDIGPLSMWLNLNGAELGSDALLERVSTALIRTGIPAHRVNLEIPEATLIVADADALARLRTLAALGVRLGIDDFGTGSASLAHLRSLPIHFLKVDPTIGRRLLEPGGRAVVDAVVAVGRALGLDVIAEGIEDRAQLEVLAQLGCTHAQGNLFAEPAPADTLVLPDGPLGPDSA